MGLTSQGFSDVCEVPRGSSAGAPMAHALVEHRSLLFTVAYEMLGSSADAEDVVQEVWLWWREVDETTVQHPRAYLVRVVTRQSLNRMRTLARRRETYVGPWLPEPLLTTPDVAEDVTLVDSVYRHAGRPGAVVGDRAGGVRPARLPTHRRPGWR